MKNKDVREYIKEEIKYIDKRKKEGLVEEVLRKFLMIGAVLLLGKIAVLTNINGSGLGCITMAVNILITGMRDASIYVANKKGCKIEKKHLKKIGKTDEKDIKTMSLQKIYEIDKLKRSASSRETKRNNISIFTNAFKLTLAFQSVIAIIDPSMAAVAIMSNLIYFTLGTIEVIHNLKIEEEKAEARNLEHNLRIEDIISESKKEKELIPEDEKCKVTVNVMSMEEAYEFYRELTGEAIPKEENHKEFIKK